MCIYIWERNENMGTHLPLIKKSKFWTFSILCDIFFSMATLNFTNLGILRFKVNALNQINIFSRLLNIIYFICLIVHCIEAKTNSSDIFHFDENASLVSYIILVSRVLLDMFAGDILQMFNYVRDSFLI